jgi:histone H3/H4
MDLKEQPINDVRKIKDAAILRLAHKANTKSMSSLAYNESDEAMCLFIEKVIQNAIKFTIQSKRMTISLDDIKSGLNELNVTELLSEQNMNTDLCLPKISFRRICDTYLPENNRWSTEALNYLQINAEAYIIGLFEDANLCSAHAGRQTLYLKDIQLARYIRRKI